MPDRQLTRLELDHFTLTPQGVVPKTMKPPFEAWEALGQTLAIMERGVQWMIGDWCRFGEQAYGEMASQVIDARGWAEETVRVYRWVAEKVPQENRITDGRLSFQHHQVVAKLPPDEQRRWLRRAAGEALESGEAAHNPWTVSQLKAAIKSGGGAAASAESGWWVLVECSDLQDQEMLLKELGQAGRRAKAVTRRGMARAETGGQHEPDGVGRGGESEADERGAGQEAP